MTIRAISGLIVFNAFILGAGAGVLWGVRGWRWWTELVRLAGVAYLLGFASLEILLMLELVLGIPIGLAAIVLSGLVVVCAGAAIGFLRGRSSPGLRPPGWRVPGISVLAALFLAGIVVYLEGLFRAARLPSIVREWDAWAFWMPKAEEIYFAGRLSPEFLQLLPQVPSYPPGLSAVQAGAFHAMGSADTTTLHLQYWFLAVGFVAAVAGLLWSRVSHAILFALLLLVLVAPSLVEWMTVAYADLPLGYLVAAAALLIGLWLDERRAWQLPAATVLLAGAMLTKREGILFAACVLFAAFVASWNARRTFWRPLVVAGVVALSLALPWRIWFTLHGLPGDGPDYGYLGAFTHLERVWPSLKLVATTLFDQDLWPVVAALACVTIVLAALAGAWRISVYAGVLAAAAVAGSTWVIWSNGFPITQEGQNPIVRLTGTTILALGVLAPLLLQRAWSVGSGGRRSPAHVPPPGPDPVGSRSAAGWAIVLVGVLSHPGAMLLGYSGSGLPGGLPEFPDAARCVSDPVPGEPVRLVIGYAHSYPEANAMRDSALAAGLEKTDVAQDGCGRLRVFVDDVPTSAAAEALSADARVAGLEPTIESDPDD